VLQGLFTLHRLLMHNQTADVAMYGTDFVDLAARALASRHSDTSKLADSCLNLCLVRGAHGPFFRALCAVVFQRS